MVPAQAAAEGLDVVQRYILALLGSQNCARVPAKLWLEKELFLLSKLRRRLAEEAEFFPYLKGPYSEVADVALEDLKRVGLVDYDEYGGDIRLTPAGEWLVAELEGAIPADVRKEIDDTKAFLNSLSEDELLVFTYFSYPEMVTGSVVKEHAESVRVPRAIALYKKGKVSLEKGAELAGLPLSDFKKRVGGAPHP